MTSHRSAITGEFVTAEYAAENPDTTVSEKQTRRPASDYSELRKLAEACPPEDTNSRWYSEDQLAQVIELAPVIVDEDRPFVAACSPTVVLGLLDELDRLRGVNHNLQVALYGANVKIVELEANLGHLRTEDIPVIQQRRDELIARTVGDLTARHRGKRVRVKASISGSRPALHGQWIIGTLDEIFVQVGELGLTLDAASIEGADHGDYLWCPYLAYGTDELDAPCEVLP